jgi:hypothetical protein
MSLKDYFETGSIIAAAVIYIYREWWKSRRDTKVVKSKSLDENELINGKIYPVIWEVLYSTFASRVFITQFHNGTNFYTGQSIQRQTISHEVNKRNVSKVGQYYDNVLLSELDHRIILDMRRGGYFHVDNIKDAEVDTELHEYMEKHNLKALYYFRILDKKTGHTVAILNIHWDRVDPILPINVSEIEDYRNKLESIFDKL